MWVEPQLPADETTAPLTARGVAQVDRTVFDHLVTFLPSTLYRVGGRLGGAMKKTSLYLDPALDSALARRAAAEGITKAELIRRTLAEAASPAERTKPSKGVFEGPGDVAANVDRYLDGFGEWR
jgi:hypothetical protein